MCVCEIIKGLAHWGKELGPFPLPKDVPLFFLAIRMDLQGS